jgi:dTDP-4-dehydrorhamnose reductase
MLGRDLAITAAEAGHDVVGATHADMDLTEPDSVAAMVGDHRPDVVMNCAAWTDVDGAEAHPEAAMKVNGEGAGTVAWAAAEMGAAIIHVSTDYVFDGTSPRPYVETDPVRPISVYGRSKLAGEQAVARANPRHAIVRSAWLFGAGGQNFVATMLRLADERDEVRVVTDQVGCPTWTGHLAEAMLALAESQAPGIHHVAGAGQCSWHDFAVEIFRQAEVSCTVQPTTSDEFVRPARRPANSVLHSVRADTPHLPSWRDGLAEYLTQRSALEAPA